MKPTNETGVTEQPEAIARGSLQQHGSAAALNHQISCILLGALNGTELRYRMDGYIRWGRVEKEIHQAVEAALNATPPNVCMSHGGHK